MTCGPCEERKLARRAADLKRRAEQPWRAFYKTRAWHQLRELRLAEEPLCRMCTALGKVTPADIVDHIEAHKGDWQAFTDFDNTQSLCKQCHDSAKQSQERLGYDKLIGVDGWPVDPKHPSNAV